MRKEAKIVRLNTSPEKVLSAKAIAKKERVSKMMEYIVKTTKKQA